MPRGLLIFLTLTASLANAAPTVSPEHPFVGSHRRISVGPWGPPQHGTAFVDVRGQLFAAWAEHTDVQLYSQDIALARVTRDGEVDESTRRLLPKTGTTAYEMNAHHPAMATSGNGFIVVWASATLVAMRFDADGNALDAKPFAISNREYITAHTPAVEWNGREYVVFFNLTNGHAAISRIAEDGTVLERDRPVTTVAFHFSGASNGLTTMLYTDAPTMVCAVPCTIPPTRRAFVTKTARESHLANQYAYGGDLATDGDGYLLAWRGVALSDKRTEVRISRLDRAGFLIDCCEEGKVVHSEPYIVPGNGAFLGGRMNVVWTGSNWLLVYEVLAANRKTDIRGLLVSPDGSAIGEPFAISADENVSENTPSAMHVGDGRVLVTYYSDMFAKSRIVDTRERQAKRRTVR